ncbi:cell division protein FtsQ/DivIB [Brachybacterium sp. AOP25-B2-12]|uniref:cell division protein FtsQ/DivIB n=1 Tax=Brachybacterium sp. AOP25-B2-12 TaxID=3457710 RepID=UPI004034AE02
MTTRRPATPRAPARPRTPRATEPAQPSSSPRTPTGRGATDTTTRAAPVPRPTTTTARRTATRPAERTDETTTAQAPGERGPGIVQAADRFRALVRPRPWRRRRRSVVITAVVVVLALVAGFLALWLLPALRVQDITVEGRGYVDAQEVDRAVAGARGTSVLMLPTGSLAAAVERVPGVRTAEVHRDWPGGMRVVLTERVPLALVTEADGTTAPVDADGVRLPAAAQQGAALVPLTVGPGSQDADGATRTMLAVLDSLPEDLRGRVSGISATTTSDVTLTVALDGGASKSVVWGDAQDADLKARVTAALLPREGTVIDVTSPVAPVTR